MRVEMNGKSRPKQWFVTAFGLFLVSPFALAQGSAAGSTSTPLPTVPQTTQAAPKQQQTPTPTLQPRDESEPPPPATGKITAFAREVSLTFSVTDSKGHFITNLQQQNFGLLDDQRPPERVVHFRQLSNLPLRVGLMIDTSNSIRSRFQFEQDAAGQFLLQILRPADRAFVEGFDVQTDIAQDYTNRIDLLDTGVHKLRPGGGTSLFDSLYKTCRDQMLTLKDDQPVRRAIVLLSDGDDDYSRAHEADAIKMCQRAETIVYTISTNVGPSKDKGDDVLQQIADATGGRAFFPTKIEDIAIGFSNIEQELRSQYSLEYVPADFKQDGSFRTIYLVSLDQRYQVHARKGYFAPRAPQ
jgi:VWFA-related protein